MYKTLQTDTDAWALLHELGHALLDHQVFATDIDLLQIEVEAWHKAQLIAKPYGIDIAWQHVEQCLDSYRDWLHARSTCPTCQLVTLQVNARLYQCFNCNNQWQVTKSRLCRPHRRQVKQKQLPITQ